MRWVLAAAALSLAAPLSVAQPAAAANTTVIIGVPNWPTAQVTSHIIANVLTERYDAAVRLRPIGTVELFDAIDRGEVDIHPEVWLPNSSVPVERYTDELGTLSLAPARVEATQHICTTQATVEMTGIHHVTDLAKPEIAAHFDTDGDGKGEMWIGAFEWSATRIERLRAKSYGYDETMMLLTMPEDMAMSSVDAAVALGMPIVFYCYAPHHVFALHDIVRLDEPAHDPATWDVRTPEEDPAWLANSKASTGWAPANYHIGLATQFEESNPDMAKFLHAMALTSDEAVAMSYAINVEGKSPEEVAAAWIDEHGDKIAEWTQ